MPSSEWALTISKNEEDAGVRERDKEELTAHGPSYLQDL